MKTLIKTGSKILASLMLVILVMLNIQVGVVEDFESSALDFVGITTTVNTTEAQASQYYCLPPYDRSCVTGTTEGGKKITIVGHFVPVP